MTTAAGKANQVAVTSCSIHLHLKWQLCPISVKSTIFYSSRSRCTLTHTDSNCFSLNRHQNDQQSVLKPFFLYNHSAVQTKCWWNNIPTKQQIKLSYRLCWCPSAWRSSPSSSQASTRPRASSSQRTPSYILPMKGHKWGGMISDWIYSIVALTIASGNVKTLWMSSDVWLCLMTDVILLLHSLDRVDHSSFIWKYFSNSQTNCFN